MLISIITNINKHSNVYATIYINIAIAQAPSSGLFK